MRTVMSSGDWQLNELEEAGVKPVYRGRYTGFYAKGTKLLDEFGEVVAVFNTHEEAKEAVEEHDLDCMYQESELEEIAALDLDLED